MAAETADLSRVIKRVIGLLNIGDEDSAYTDSVAEFGEYALQEIKDAIFEADVIFCETIIENSAHPFRNAFLSPTPIELTNGAALPVHSGVHDHVECFVEDDWKTGKQSRNRSRLAAITDNEDIPAIVKERYYCIENNRLFTAAPKARVYFCEYAADRTTTPSLQSPQKYERGIIAWAVAGLYKDTTERETHGFYERQAQAFLQMAAGGATNFPEIEEKRRNKG